jgi:glycosyltransferase involved in cell wall biosynthesis
MSHRVLIITYLFPPSGGIGPPRYVAYTRHLPAHGCEVFVITAKNPNTPLYDPGLLKLVPPQTRVYRVFNPDVPYAFRDRIWKKISGGGGASADKAAPDRGVKALLYKAAKEAIQRFFNPDVQKFWAPFVVRKARKVIREHDIQTVILNTPPFSLHAIIPRLKREFPQVTWITEVRDDWLGYYLEYFDSARTSAKHRLAVKMEGAGMRASDFVVAVTPAQRDAIRDRYPDQPPGKFLCVTNGYDAEIFEDFRPARTGGDKMIVTYFGTFYASPPYDLTGYFDALDTLPPEIRDRVETRFIGRIAKEAEPLLEGRKSKIVKLGFFPRAEGARKLQETDYLLMPANDPTQHAGKLFDYLATGLPILAFSPSGSEVTRLIQQTGSGLAVDGRDPAAVKQALLDAFERLRGGPNCFPTPDRAAVAAFERKNLVAQLVRLTGIGKA